MAPSSARPFPDMKLSSAVSAKVTGEDNDLNLTNMDLIMKLHYIKAVYFFASEAAEGLRVYDLKEPLFALLERYYPAGGRIRRSESDRPFIKCNDGGVRVVEANSDKTIGELLETENVGASLHHSLAYNQVLGPDLGFSPLAYIQFTRFKCGGLSVGLSWAHVLGDVFSASAFINTWAELLAGHVPENPLHVPDARKIQSNASPPPPPSTSSPGKPLFLKKVGHPIGDYWIAAGNGQMQTHSFDVTADQLRRILSNTPDPSRAAEIPPFELICAMMWKSLAKINGCSTPRVVTICEEDGLLNRKKGAPSNGMEISVVESDLAVENCDLLDLAKLMREKRVPENSLIEGAVGGDGEELEDYIIYGANLTFVNLEGADVYGVKLKGHRAITANFTINGAGEEGVVLVLPGPEEESERRVTVVMAIDQIDKLREEIQRSWGLI